MQPLRSLLDSERAGAWPGGPVPVALVITDLDVGGAERALVALATGLDRSRWRPSVVGLAGEGALAAPLRAAGIEVSCLDADRRRPIAAVSRLAGALRRLRPALVQGFLFHANVAAKLAAPLAGRPPVVGGLRVAEREKRWHLAVDRMTRHLSPGSVCVSRGVRDFAIRAGHLDPDRLVVIPNGIDPAPYDRAEPARLSGAGRRIALYVGRITAQKGLPVLLEAFAAIAPERPDWRLVIVGDGPDRPGLEGATAGDGRVAWLGRREDVPSLLKAADLLVLPSLWEGMPNVVLEAMAAGRAVVASDVEGVRDLVVPGATGWVVPPGDRRAWTEALRVATASPDLAAMGARGRERIGREFGMGSVVASYEHVWAAALGLRRDVLPAPLPEFRADGVATIGASGR